jgi:hypothetical protein
MFRGNQRATYCMRHRINEDASAGDAGAGDAGAGRDCPLLRLAVPVTDVWVIWRTKQARATGA